MNFLLFSIEVFLFSLYLSCDHFFFQWPNTFAMWFAFCVLASIKGNRKRFSLQTAITIAILFLLFLFVFFSCEFPKMLKVKTWSIFILGYILIAFVSRLEIQINIKIDQVGGSIKCYCNAIKIKSTFNLTIAMIRCI